MIYLLCVCGKYGRAKYFILTVKAHITPVYIVDISQQKCIHEMMNKKFHYVYALQLFQRGIYVKTNDSSDTLMILWIIIFPYCVSSNTGPTNYSNNSFICIVDKQEEIFFKLLPTNWDHFHILVSGLLISGVWMLNEHMANLNDVQKELCNFRIQSYCPFGLSFVSHFLKWTRMFYKYCETYWISYVFRLFTHPFIHTQTIRKQSNSTELGRYEWHDKSFDQIHTIWSIL